MKIIYEPQNKRFIYVVSDNRPLRFAWLAMTKNHLGGKKNGKGTNKENKASN